STGGRKSGNAGRDLRAGVRADIPRTKSSAVPGRQESQIIHTIALPNLASNRRSIAGIPSARPIQSDPIGAAALNVNRSARPATCLRNPERAQRDRIRKNGTQCRIGIYVITDACARLLKAQFSICRRSTARILKLGRKCRQKGTVSLSECRDTEENRDRQ